MKPCLPILAAVFLLAWSGLFPPAAAQSPLERLDRQIRQRAGGSQPATPPTAGIPKPPPPDLGARRQAEPAYLGVAVSDRSDRGRGVRVLEVYAGGPADKVGIRRNDLLVGIGDIRVRQEADLIETVKAFSPGQQVNLDVLREGQPPMRFRVTLADYRAMSAPPPGLPDPVLGPPGVVPADTRPQIVEPIPTPPRTAPLDRPLVRTSRIEQLERRVEQLERRVAELERRLNEPPR